MMYVRSSGNRPATISSCVTRPMTATTMMKLNTVLLPLVVVVVSLRGREEKEATWSRRQGAAAVAVA